MNCCIDVPNPEQHDFRVENYLGRIKERLPKQPAAFVTKDNPQYKSIERSNKSTSPQAGAKNLIFCSIFSIFIDFDAIFNGNWPRMIASEPGNIGNLPGMIVSFPGNILWTVRSIFELYYNSNMDRTINI